VVSVLPSCAASTDDSPRASLLDQGRSPDASPFAADATDSALESQDFSVPLDATDGASDQWVIDADAPTMDQGVSPDAEPVSGGCGQTPEIGPGSTYVELDVGPEGDGIRQFLLSVPAGYDPNTSHSLIVGFAGRDAAGGLMQRYLGLERTARPDEIFVYPDPLRRAFQGWGTYGGWLLGPYAHPAHGLQDLRFTRTMVEFLQDRYCIDPQRIFATGHSWGGDMAHVVACFLGDLFRAAVPVAANRPYWFEQPGGMRARCEGQTAVWTFFGIADDAFLDAQSYPGEFGDLVRDFWLEENACAGVDDNDPLELDVQSLCYTYGNCAETVRYCLYGPDTGHQIPPYYSEATMHWFRSFNNGRL